jgi:AraC-like DNA-binding protein
MIKPRFEKYRPSPLLQPYVKEYYLFEGPNTGMANIIPSWQKSILALQFGGSIRASVNGGLSSVNPASINGVVTKPYHLVADGTTIRFFIIEFTPIGLYALFRENNEHFVNASVNAFDVIPANRNMELVEALAEEYNMERKSAIVDHFLLQLLPSEKTHFRIRHIVDSLHLIEESRGEIRVAEISNKLGLSERFIRKRFYEVTGVSPKQYARIIRFQTNFNTVMDNQGQLPSLPSHSNYYDQSHFIKEFKSFTGYAPASIPKEPFRFARTFT